jgi:hypothetical protein
MSDRKCADQPWVRYNPMTATYDTPDGTSVPAEIVDSACCLADVLRISLIRAAQRVATREKQEASAP